VKIETKRAKDIQRGDWVVYGPMAYQAMDVYREGRKVIVQTGYLATLDFTPHQMVEIEAES